MQRISKLIIPTSFFILGATGLQGVKAADFGGTALRGSIQPQQQSTAALWDGVYVGALGGYSSGTVGKTSGYANIAPVVNGLEIDSLGGLRQSLVTPSRAVSNSNFGGFVGYNSTWEDAVVGIEVDYMRTKLNAESNLDYAVRFNGKNAPITEYNVKAKVNTSSKITDMATLRGRVGYAVGNALPFLTVGVAFAHGRFSNNTYINVDQTISPSTVSSPATGLSPFERGYTNRDRFAAGLALGAGIDYAFTSAIFLRAEYQYIKFSSLGGGQVAINNARAGVAAKF